MEILLTIGLWVAVIVLITGIVRVTLSPYTGFVNFLLEIMLIDWIFDVLALVISLLSDED